MIGYTANGGIPYGVFFQLLIDVCMSTLLYFMAVHNPLSLISIASEIPPGTYPGGIHGSWLYHDCLLYAAIIHYVPFRMQHSNHLIDFLTCVRKWNSICFKYVIIACSSLNEFLVQIGDRDLLKTREQALPMNKLSLWEHWLPGCTRTWHSAFNYGCLTGNYSKIYIRFEFKQYSYLRDQIGPLQAKP